METEIVEVALANGSTILLEAAIEPTDRAVAVEGLPKLSDLAGD